MVRVKVREVDRDSDLGMIILHYRQLVMIDDFEIAYCIASALRFRVKCKISLFLSYSWIYCIIPPFASHSVIDITRYPRVSEF